MDITANTTSSSSLDSPINSIVLSHICIKAKLNGSAYFNGIIFHVWFTGCRKISHCSSWKEEQHAISKWMYKPLRCIYPGHKYSVLQSFSQSKQSDYLHFFQRVLNVKGPGMSRIVPPKLSFTECLCVSSQIRKNRRSVPESLSMSCKLFFFLNSLFNLIEEAIVESQRAEDYRCGIS